MREGVHKKIQEYKVQTNNSQKVVCIYNRNILKV